MMNNHRNNLRDSLVGSRNFPAGSHPHRRGHSLSNGFPKDGDENLDLFSKNRRSLSVASSDESSDVKLGRLSLGSAKLARNGIDDLLSSTEGGKHDYDWLLTPPGTLLFPSSDGTELQPISVAPRTSSLARSSSKASRLSVSQSESHHSSRPTRSSSVTRPSISSSQFSTYSSNRSSSILNTSSASVSSYIRPSSPITRSPSTARPSTPSTRQTPSRSSTPSRVRPTPNSSSVDKARPSQSSEKDGTPRVKTMWNMREKLGFFVFVLALLCGSCLGRSAVENNCLNVTSPESVKGLYECSIGNFGVPHYGETLVGRVEYPKANQKACTSFEDVNLSFKLKRGGLPTFLLVDRGDCYFTLKAWNAQNGGASAILVADDKAEPLITMDKAEEENPIAEYLQKIMIPSVLIGMALGDSIKKALSSGEMVNLNLDWTEALPHPDERVEYEFWTDSCRECGPKYDRQIEFVKNFKGVAQILEQKGYTQFTPHYITRFCPEAFVLSKHCKSRCINRGRYCAPDPEQDFSRGYDGKDVVVENLRAACVFKVANETGKPWLWWDYVTEFSIRCPMKDKKYNKDCADQVVRSFGISLKDVDKCVGDPDADVENPVLKVEQDAQIGEGSRGDVTILPTLVINNRQYRGKLDKGAVLKAICAGFEETTEPAICLSSDIETNECLENNGGCWQDKAANVTACKDTFRGRVCECPAVQGVKFVGDGYTHCSASGSLRCELNNGGCWKGNEEGRTFSACSEEHSEGCKCPAGFKGDGVNSCEDVDECKERMACQCPGCKCKNTWGSYECSCGSGLLYMREHDTCISKEASTEVSWSFVWFIILGLAAAGVAGYALYKYRIRRYMDSEIRAIMAQYMPLDSQGEIPTHHSSHGDI